MTVEISTHTKRKAKFISDQWMEMERTWGALNKAILTKAQKINRVFNIDQLTNLSSVIADGEEIA